MKLSVLSIVAALLLVAHSDAQTVAPGAKKPCAESGGVAIKLNGNFGFCYLKGRRMRRGSVFAQCSDGTLACYEDEGIPDKPRKKITCIAPEPGFCGSDKDATPSPTTAPTPMPSAANGTAAGSNGMRGDDIEVGEDEDEDDEDDETDETRDMDSRTPHHTVNPSALVAGNLPNGDAYDDDDETDDDAVY